MAARAPLRVLDLFSGIGGFSLGLERAGMRTVAFCEIEPFCRRVLAKHWPEVPCYDDVRTLTAERLRADGIAVDVICGGFPCQDISVAGRGAGLGGERSGLWSEYARIIGEVRPRWVIIENVSALRSRGLDAVLRALAALGYDAEWHCIPAAAVGLPHVRERVWVVAYPEGEQGIHQSVVGEALQLALLDDGVAGQTSPWPSATSAICRVDDGIPDRVVRTAALGNAVVPQIPELIGRAILRAEAA